MHLFAVHLSVVLSSLCGSMYYGVTSHESSVFKKIVFLLISFVTGLVAAECVANILSEVLPGNVDVELSVGALVGAAFAIRLLSLLGKLTERRISDDK